MSALVVAGMPGPPVGARAAQALHDLADPFGNALAGGRSATEARAFAGGRLLGRVTSSRPGDLAKQLGCITRSLDIRLIASGAASRSSACSTLSSHSYRSMGLIASPGGRSRPEDRMGSLLAQQRPRPAGPTVGSSRLHEGRRGGRRVDACAMPDRPGTRRLRPRSLAGPVGTTARAIKPRGAGQLGLAVMLRVGRDGGRRCARSHHPGGRGPSVASRSLGGRRRCQRPTPGQDRNRAARPARRSKEPCRRMLRKAPALWRDQVRGLWRHLCDGLQDYYHCA